MKLTIAHRHDARNMISHQIEHMLIAHIDSQDFLRLIIGDDNFAVLRVELHAINDVTDIFGEGIAMSSEDLLRNGS